MAQFAWLTSRAPGQDGEFLAFGEPVGREVIVVDGEDDTEPFAGAEVDKRGVCEIHRAVGVFGHECVDLR